MSSYNWVVLVAAFAFTTPASAATFSANGGGATGSSSTIHAGGAGDYLSLVDAAADYNSFAGGAAGNYTFYIATDLSETTSVAFANLTNSYNITLKPAPSATPTVTFTNPGDNSGPSGHLVIGSQLATFTTSKMDNFVVDGSNAVDGTSLDLVFTQTTPTATSEYPNTRFIRVVGDSDNVVIKNFSCVLKSTGGSSMYGIEFSSRDGGAPDNWTIENCSITMKTGNAAQGITTSNGGTGSAPQSGWMVKNNFIDARTRGIFLQNSGTGTVADNRINIAQTASGNLSHGIFLNSAGTATNFTINIVRNKFDSLLTANSSAGAFGIRGITIDASSAGAPIANYNIFNNFFSGFTFTTTAAASDQVYNGIFIGNTSQVNARIYHNSFNMPLSGKVTGATLGRAAAFALNNTATGTAYDLKNNIVLYGQTGTTAAAIQKVTTGTLTSNYNNLYVETGARTGRVNTTNYATLANWQGAGFDANSQAISPVSGGTSPGTWVSASDLHFNDFPGGLISGTPLAAVTTDIDGEARSATLPYIGADEMATPLPVTMSEFSIE